jgi:hypothetical protein
MPLRFVKERKKKSHLRVVGVAAVEGKEAGLSLICSCSHKSKQKSHHSLRSFMYDVSNRKNSTTKYTSFFCQNVVLPPVSSTFCLRTNQPPTTSEHYFSPRTNQHQPSAASWLDGCLNLVRLRQPLPFLLVEMSESEPF